MWSPNLNLSRYTSRHQTIEDIKIKIIEVKNDDKYLIYIIIITLDIKDSVLKDLIKGQGLRFTIWNGWFFIIYLDSDIYIVNKIVNTYAWIIDTAISRTIRDDCPIKIMIIEELK